MASINVLGSQGHLSLEWDPADPESVAGARAEVERLRRAGYTFWLTEPDVPADAVAAGNGRLVVKAPDEVLVRQVEDPVAEFEAANAVEPTGTPRRRGRPPRQPTVTAVPRMAGG